jgi:predicted PurR-regulated permease PerM
MWGLYHLLSDKINYVIAHSADIMAQLQRFDGYFYDKTGNHLFSDESMKKVQSSIGEALPLVLGRTAGALTTIAMMYFILYYLLINTGKIEEMVNKLLPVSEKNTRRFADELEANVYSNVLGAPVLAILQGLFAGLGFWFFGLEEPWFWGVICGFMSFLPLVGTAVIWVPAGLYQLASASHWQGYGILIFGLVVITNVDHVFRLMIQKKFNDVHPLVTILGVIIGIDYFGIPGIVFGPLMISYFLLMIKMYNEEYGEESKNG